MNRNFLIALLVALLIGAAYLFFTAFYNIAEAPIDTGDTPQIEEGATTTEETAVTPVLIPLHYGETSLKIGQTASFEALMIKPVAITEDSRCPVGVTCIQAGTVAVDMEIITPQGTVKNNIELNETVNVSGILIKLTNAAPLSVAGATIPSESYFLTFTVQKEVKQDIVIDIPKPVVTDPMDDGCYVGGCSAQFCTDNPALVSTCEYKEEYACYQKADCARQQTGECGWTESASLDACLLDAKATTL